MDEEGVKRICRAGDERGFRWVGVGQDAEQAMNGHSCPSHHIVSLSSAAILTHVEVLDEVDLVRGVRLGLLLEPLDLSIAVLKHLPETSSSV